MEEVQNFENLEDFHQKKLKDEQMLEILKVVKLFKQKIEILLLLKCLKN